MYQLRSYQKMASDAAVTAFKSKKGRNSVIVLPTGAGKSIVIADIASRIDGHLLVLQPSKEILEQNFAKLQSYGVIDCGCYSASVGRKDINRITFAMIGSIMRHMNDFKHFRYVLIDECHNVSPKDGMYKTFIEDSERMVIGLTATPYRLYSTGLGSEIRFITRTRPRIFTDVLYCCQVSELVAKGYLAKLNYYDITSMDISRIRSNSTGADFDERSLEEEYQRTGFYGKVVNTVERLITPKSGSKRRGLLVFTRFVREAERICRDVHGCEIVTGETPKIERENILKRFKAGEIKAVVNVGTLTTGFDYPELDTILLARPTKSLSLYYQMVGRGIRPSERKDAWIVDMCGNIKRFGHVEDLKVVCDEKKKWSVTSRGRRLTNVLI